MCIAYNTYSRYCFKFHPKWTIFMLPSRQATSVARRQFDAKDGPVPPGPPLSWKPSNIRGSPWGEEVDTREQFSLRRNWGGSEGSGQGTPNFMDRWAKRSLEELGIYNQDEEKQFSTLNSLAGWFSFVFIKLDIRFFMCFSLFPFRETCWIYRN